MSKLKIVHEREKCIGCGACAAINPNCWKMNVDDAKVDLLNSEEKGNEFILELDGSKKEDNVEAAESCPVNCIFIFEDGKKLI
jgi:ferredoxin